MKWKKLKSTRCQHMIMQQTLSKTDHCQRMQTHISVNLNLSRLTIHERLRSNNEGIALYRSLYLNFNNKSTNNKQNSIDSH
jgi:hypothetical protein